jgi:DNA-binding transcriptional LysR family regulator
VELRQLEHFVTVAQERHFTRAADLLQISQSGLSASIRALESELGTSLFVRSTRRVELTAAGRALLEESHRTLASAAAAREAVLAVRGVLQGTLAVGAEQCLGGVDVPRELARFRTEHPGVGIRLSFAGSTALLDLVSAGRLDLAVVAVCDPAPHGVELHPMGTQDLVLLCNPDHPFARQEGVELADAAGGVFVGFQPDWAARVLAGRAFSAAGFPYRVDLEVNDVHTLLDLVEHGLGVAIVPSSFTHKRPDRLRAIPLLGEAVPAWTVAVAVPQTATPAADALLAQLTASADGRRRGGPVGGRV